MVSVRGTDTICTIQKINHLLYRFERTDTKNQFLKIKKTSFCRRPDPRRGSGGGRRWSRPDPVEGGGGARPRGHRGGEGGRRWAPLILVVAEVGKEGIGGSRLSSWSPRWGRRVSVGAAHPRGHRGGEGGCRWEPLILMVAEVGKEGVGGPPPTTSASPCRRLPPPPRQAQRPPCHRLPRRLSPRQNQRKERRERTE
jgi:hypothetical protein